MIIVGLLVLAISVPLIKTEVVKSIGFLEGINNFILIGVGGVFVVVGVLVGRKKGGNKLSELPIFEGNKVVGYRRD